MIFLRVTNIKVDNNHNFISNNFNLKHHNYWLVSIQHLAAFLTLFPEISTSEPRWACTWDARGNPEAHDGTQSRTSARSARTSKQLITKCGSRELTFATIICISKSANLLPKHILFPYPKGSVAKEWCWGHFISCSCILCPVFDFSHLSGRNWSLLGNCSSELLIAKCWNMAWT